MKRSPRPAVAFVAAFLLACGEQAYTPVASHGSALAPAPALSAAASVGKDLFFDTSLSNPPGESCATCHDPAFAYADPRGGPSSEGAVAGRFGPRNAPSLNYAAYVPPLTAAGDETGYAGGLFLDGRAPNLEAQIEGPLLNVLEMNNADRAAVVAKLQAGPYAEEFQQLYGAEVLGDVDTAFADLESAIAAFEREGIRSRFTSKYDAYLAGAAQLTDSEARGLAIFEDTKRGNCASCHLDQVDADGGAPLFTDFGYDNLGIPKNLANPFYTLSSDLNPLGTSYVDHGLSGAIINPRQDGKFKAPSLRNVALTAPYGHNGYFADLASIIRFYNSRDVRGAGWDAPEIDFGLNVTDMGNLGLSDQDMGDLEAYLRTLTDLGPAEAVDAGVDYLAQGSKREP